MGSRECKGFGFGSRERGRGPSVGSLSLEDICRGSHPQATASHGLLLSLGWAGGLVPRLDSDLCVFGTSQTVGCGRSPGSLGWSAARMQTKVSGPGRSASTSKARATCAGLRSSLPTGWCQQLTASSMREISGGPLGGQGSPWVFWARKAPCM